MNDEGEKVFTPAEWMNELRRWWNYEEIGNMASIKLTKEEFLDYMARTRATEVTHQIPEALRTQPTKMIPPKKQVRLMIGEGDNKFEIGVAELESMPDGTTKVEITLTEEKYAQALGTGVKLTGVIPAPDPSDLHKFEQYKEEWFLPRDHEGE